MKKILVTGVRAPAALDIIHSLSASGYEVYAADSMRFPLGRFCSPIKGYVQLPSPRHAFTDFKAKLLACVKQHKIDIIIPTCEEVFYLSACKPELKKHCQVFCEDIDVLARFHNKHTFQELAQEHNLGAIETFLIQQENVPLPALKEDQRYVAKPTFSRFGDKAILNLAAENISEHLSKNLFPWVIQKYIQGEEFCAYALCRDGTVIAQVTYQPYFRAGQGSSIYFKTVQKPKIAARIHTFVRQLNYTGQIGFDFIEQRNGEVFVLECNPRCTSGIHLIPHIDWNAALAGDKLQKMEHRFNDSKMVALAMLVYGWRSPNKHGFKAFLNAFFCAKDVMSTQKGWRSSFVQLVSLTEMIWRSIKNRQPLKDASTADIEWDGQKIR